MDDFNYKMYTIGNEWYLEVKTLDLKVSGTLSEVTQALQSIILNVTAF